MKRVEFTDIPLTARPEPKVWQVLTEQAVAGEATLLDAGNTYAVQFADEPESIPF